MHTLQEQQKYVVSALPSAEDDAAFCREMSYLDLGRDAAALAAHVGVGRALIEGGKAGRYVPHPALRAAVFTWLRERVRERLDQAPMKAPDTVRAAAQMEAQAPRRG
jgi:hypothetical protein